MKLQYWPHGFLGPDYGSGSVLRTFTKTKDSIVLSATWFYGALSVELCRGPILGYSKRRT